MKKIIMASAIIFIVSVVFTSMVYPQMEGKGWEKTVMLPSGEVILNMSGKWDVLHEFQKKLEWLGEPSSNIVLITQEGNTFSGVSQIDTKWYPKGTEMYKGELDKDGFKEVQVYTMENWQKKWVPVTWEISEHGNKIVFVDRDR